MGACALELIESFLHIIGMPPPIFLGITGGSGSGKTWLAQRVLEHFGSSLVTIVEQDWYYRDLSHLPQGEAAQTNFDHPDAIEFELLEAHLQTLAKGKSVGAPQYEFSTFTRSCGARRRLDSTRIIVVEGLFVLLRSAVRELLWQSVFVETPADIRLLRRIRRDMEERGYELDRILEFWETRAYPMFNDLVEPQRSLASRLWLSLEDRTFVPEFLADLEKRLASDADGNKADS